MKQQKITLEQAELMVKSKDKVRLAFVEEFYEIPWGSIQAFDLIVNTGKISPDLATSWVIEGVKAFMSGRETDQPAIASLVVDRILAESVCDELKCKKEHR